MLHPAARALQSSPVLWLLQEWATANGINLPNHYDTSNQPVFKVDEHHPKNILQVGMDAVGLSYEGTSQEISRAFASQGLVCSSS